jgi:hypothetical protein
MKAHALLDRPLPAGCAGSKDGKCNSSNNDGNAGGSGQSLIAHRIGMVLPSPLLVEAKWQQGWHAIEGKGNKEGNCKGDKGGK